MQRSPERPAQTFAALRRIAAWLLVGLLWATAAPAQPAPHRTLLFGAWTPDETGLLDPSGVTAETRRGFDLRLLDAIGAHTGLGFVMVATEGNREDDKLARGAIDFSLPEIGPGDAPDTVLLSTPYRQRTDMLFLSTHVKGITGGGIEALRAALRGGLRIAIDRDTGHGPEVTALLEDPAFARQVIRQTRVLDNVDSLLAGRVDGFLAIRLLALEAIALRQHAAPRIVMLPKPVEVLDIHIRFSAATVHPDTVALINRTIQDLRQDGTAVHFRNQTITPVLLRLAAAASWFFLLDALGTIAFALSGVLIARREGYSLVGAFVLAALPALGGGVVRDLLVGRAPIAILASPLPLVMVIATVVTCFVLYRLLDQFRPQAERLRRWERGRAQRGHWLSIRNVHEVTDALGLAAFTVIGVAVAVRYWAEPLWLWGPLCAALSGAGGGILRDVIRADSRNPALRTSFYAEVCVIWGFALSLTVDWLAREERPELLRISVAIAVLGAFLTRMAAVALRVKSPRF